MKNKIIDVIKFFFGWPIALLALIFIGKIIIPSLHKIAHYLQHLNILELLLSFLLFILYFYARSILWQRLLIYKGQRFSLIDTAFLWSISEIKRFVPGNVWAFVGRTAAFSNEELKKGTVVSAIILEAECVCLASMFVSFFAFFFICSVFLPLSFQTSFLYTLLIIIADLVGFIFIFGKYVAQFFPKFSRHFFPTHSAKENATLLFFACVSLIFFGLGTYTSIDALFMLHSASLVTMVGLFSFSFFAGYASLITPMGLGVREAVITKGLATILPLSLAGLAALFTRICIIAAEVVFLVLAYSIRKLL